MYKVIGYLADTSEVLSTHRGYEAARRAMNAAVLGGGYTAYELVVG